MVKLLIGHKGSGKTKQMIDLANTQAQNSNGSVIFINKNSRLMLDLSYMIRVICMEDFTEITNSDEYIGFLYGIISLDSDIETIYIDSILKHANFQLEDIPGIGPARRKALLKAFGSLKAVREAVGPFFPLEFRMSGAEFVEERQLKIFSEHIRRGDRHDVVIANGKTFKHLVGSRGRKQVAVI